MIKERPLFRRRLKARWRLALQATLKIPCRGVYGLSYTLVQHLDPKKPISLIDVGAHDGEFAFGVACYCGLTKGILVEPLPDKLPKLQARFRPPNYHVFGCALAAEAGTAVLRVNELDATSSLLALRRDIPEVQGLALGKERLVECPQRTLDSVAAEAGLDGIDLLKIDVQGAEHLVLAGARSALERTRMIWVECSFKPIYDGSSTFSDIFSTLNAAGFQLLDWSPAWRSASGELLQVDALFTRR